MTDPQDWLAQYALSGSDAAFRELVTRYVDLVYSTALRLVGGDAHRAKDVTQTVFVNLGRVARMLPKDVKLGGWLHRDTCFTAATLMRGERRRQARERQAAEMNALHSASEADYSLVAPALDEAINELGDADRTAILLRFYEQQEFRSIGVTLGSSEDAARMRVTRALEKLENFLKRRGITTTAASLSVVLSANAVQAAPVGLALTISAVGIVGTAVQASTAIATKTIVMTTLQKTIIGAALIAVVGTGIFEAHQNSESRNQIHNLQQQQNSLNEQLAQLQREHDDATNQLDGLLAENARLKSNSNEHELLKLRGQVAAASRAAADATAKTQGLKSGTEQSQVERDDERKQARAHLDQFFKLTNLSREKADQYVDLEVEMKRRQSERMKALLGGTLSVAEAVRQRDQDTQEQQNQRRELLGPDGWATLQSIADGMRDGVAKRLTGAAQASMRDNPLTQEQSDRLQSAIKAEVAASSMDDTDLFRPEGEWTQMVSESQQHVLQAASEFLTTTQQQTLEFLVGENLKQMLQQRDQRRKAIGITP